MSLNMETMPKLGFGLMRLPTVGKEIDAEQVERMVDAYMAAGFNYFDTAYVYHGGHSEEAVKTAITERYPRDRFFLATKLPAWCLKEKEDRDRIFSEQLERCGVDYFDFYLLHCVEDGNNGDTYEKLDCYSWAAEKRAEGKIRHFGFSFHGTPGYLEEVLDRHPEVEFVQIQLNYLDWENPDVCSGRLYEILRERNIPIVVMEPVKGGTLASLTPELEEKLSAVRPGASPASLALRFVGSLPGIMTILSGMSTEEQMEDNLATFRDFEPLTDSDRALVEEVCTEWPKIPQIGCTSCRYCVDGCPMSIPIPDIFRIANFLRRTRRGISAKQYYEELTAETGRASDCVACGQCENVCPQHLPVIELLKECGEKLEG
ncbi:MAG: aldo/keto reductase [Oscillospiraceae bacterium]|nr:aldo/keto reductase [Oscillospiraceae bacterium]